MGLVTMQRHPPGNFCSLQPPRNSLAKRNLTMGDLAPILHDSSFQWAPPSTGPQIHESLSWRPPLEAMSAVHIPQSYCERALQWKVPCTLAAIHGAGMHTQDSFAQILQWGSQHPRAPKIRKIREERMLQLTLNSSRTVLYLLYFSPEFSVRERLMRLARNGAQCSEPSMPIPDDSGSWDNWLKSRELSVKISRIWRIPTMVLQNSDESMTPSNSSILVLIAAYVSQTGDWRFFKPCNFQIFSTIGLVEVLLSNGGTLLRSWTATRMLSTSFQALFPFLSESDQSLRKSMISFVGWLLAFENDDLGKWADDSNSSHESIVSLTYNRRW